MKNLLVLALMLVSAVSFANEHKKGAKKEVPAECKELKGKAKKECVAKAATPATETAAAPAATPAAAPAATEHAKK